MWRQHSGSLQSESFQTFTYFTFFNLSCYAETNSKKKFKFKSTPTPDWQRESSNLNISEKKFWNIALRHSDCSQLNNYSLHPHDSDDSSFVPACGDILTLFLSNCWWGAMSGWVVWVSCLGSRRGAGWPTWEYSQLLLSHSCVVLAVCSRSLSY